MNKYKVQLHCHTKNDPEDWIFHSEKDLIDRAACHGYEVLSITCHNKIVYSDGLKKYAEEKGILLIPGIEKSVSKKHVVIINAHSDSEKILNFGDLSRYRNKHPESLIIAPHPYHPLPIRLVSLNKKLEKYAHLFDAVEFSSFHTKKFNFNKKAQKKAEVLKKPMIGTSDNHVLSLINDTYSNIYSDKKTKEDIIKSIKEGNIEIVTKPIKLLRLVCMTARLTTLELTKRLLKKLKLM